MRDMNGTELKTGDKVVYEYHGYGNGLQQAFVTATTETTATVKPTTTSGAAYGRARTLKNSGGVLKLSA